MVSALLSRQPVKKRRRIPQLKSLKWKVCEKLNHFTCFSGMDFNLTASASSFLSGTRPLPILSFLASSSTAKASFSPRWYFGFSGSATLNVACSGFWDSWRIACSFCSYKSFNNQWLLYEKICVWRNFTINSGNIWKEKHFENNQNIDQFTFNLTFSLTSIYLSFTVECAALLR